MKHHLNEDFMPHATVAGLSLSDRFWNWANVAVEKLLREPPAPDYLRQEFLLRHAPLSAPKFLG